MHVQAQNHQSTHRQMNTTNQSPQIHNNQLQHVPSNQNPQQTQQQQVIQDANRRWFKKSN